VGVQNAFIDTTIATVCISCNFFPYILLNLLFYKEFLAMYFLSLCFRKNRMTGGISNLCFQQEVSRISTGVPRKKIDSTGQPCYSATQPGGSPGIGSGYTLKADPGLWLTAMCGN
jgi:hypothetical protein